MCLPISKHKHWAGSWKRRPSESVLFHLACYNPHLNCAIDLILRVEFSYKNWEGQDTFRYRRRVTTHWFERGHWVVSCLKGCQKDPKQWFEGKKGISFGFAKSCARGEQQYYVLRLRLRVERSFNVNVVVLRISSSRAIVNSTELQGLHKNN